MADVTFTFSGDATSLQNALNEIKGEIGKTKESVKGLAGQFASASELARCIGIQKHLLSDLLALLNMPVKEIEKWLFETY